MSVTASSFMPSAVMAVVPRTVMAVGTRMVSVMAAVSATMMPVAVMPAPRMAASLRGSDRE